jgi:acyl-CoA synthetase (AMP-forming)/AMP-acid ligase II
MALTRFDYRVIAPREWSSKVMGKGWADLADLPWIGTPHGSAQRRLLDDVFRPMGSSLKRVAFSDQEEAMIDLVEGGNGLGLTRDSVLDHLKDKVAKWWLPDDVVFVDEIPQTATGKISKVTLRERFRDYRFPSS